jgi:aspartyl-tRNA(Asn)/glutamyl-tRNA(Gln) amidotransferase subunit C
MARIDRSDVERVAALARLELGESEALGMVRHLEAILEYVETLREVDTEGVAATSHVIALATPLRPDVAAERLDPRRAISNAPVREGFAFVVPKVLEEDEA